MSLGYDPKAGVQGPAAALTMAGLAVALVAGLYRPLFAFIAGGIGALLAIAAWGSRRNGRLALVARLGVGLAVGAVLIYVLDTLGVLPRSAGA